ncbi:MAG: hypothetical protein ACREGJ_01495 [Candidatus Saccharimonadales bacterium]
MEALHYGIGTTLQYIYLAIAQSKRNTDFFTFLALVSAITWMVVFISLTIRAVARRAHRRVKRGGISTHQQ